MPKDQASNVGSESQSFRPYSSRFNGQDGRTGVSRAGPSSSIRPVIPQLPASSVKGIGPQLPSSHLLHAHSGESSTLTHSSPSGCQWMQALPPTAPLQRALTASQPPLQLAPTDNVAPRPPTSKRPGEGRRNLVATNVGTTPLVYDGYAQVSASRPPHAPVQTNPIFSSSYAWMQDPGAITMSLPLSRAPTAPPAPPLQRPVESLAQFGSGLMLEPSLSSLYNPNPHLPSFDPFGAMLDLISTSSECREWINQIFSSPNIGTGSTNPQPPAAPVIDIPLQSSFQWTAEKLELPSNPPHLALPPVGSVDDLSLGLSQGSRMVATAPGTWSSPAHHPTPHTAPCLTLPVSDPNYCSPQHQRDKYVVNSSYSTVVSTSASESLRPPKLFPALDSSKNRASSRHAGAPSFFSGANDFRMRDMNVTVHAAKPGTCDRSIDGWELLLKNTARNALHNSRARYDAPKCDDDTRLEVTAEITGWIKDRAHPQRLLCMTGAAGSGKSALQQSIAECCAKDNILGAAYFISVADASRNTAATIVPTIAYQLGSKHPTLQCSIAAAVERDPLIFDLSLEAQIDALIVRPFESLQRSKECDISTFPYAILIDGLDECKAEPSTAADLRHVNPQREAEKRQAELLTAIRNLILNDDLPFRIFIASRPELAIRTALGTGGSLHNLAYHIQLSDQYDATEDMRRYLRRRFQDIGLRIGQPHWFTEGDIDTLVRAASGQFVYVATVFKYVSEPRASPAHMLKTVLNWTPEQVTRPFEALDMLYAYILSSAKDAYEAVDAHSGRDFLLLLRAFRLDIPSSIVSALLNLESDILDILTSDLRSLVHLQKDESDSIELVPYHKSLYDFMDQESRARELFIPEARSYTHLAKCCMQRIIEHPELKSLPDRREDLSCSEKCLLSAIEWLAEFLSRAVAIDDEIVDFTHKGGWHKVDMALSIPLGFDLIFEGWGNELWELVQRIDQVAKDLKKRRPEVAAIMRKYSKRWNHLIKERKGEEYGLDSDKLDSSSGSDDDSSD